MIGHVAIKMLTYIEQLDHELKKASNISENAKANKNNKEEKKKKQQNNGQEENK